MKIVINQLEQIAGVEIYPIISLLIFLYLLYFGNIFSNENGKARN